MGRNVGKAGVGKMRRDLSDKLVLIVEDDPDSREMLQMILEMDVGVRTAVAEDGEIALQRVVDSRPNLVLLDLRLPKRDGFDVLRQIKADPATAAIPVIVLTTGALPRDPLLAREAGCDDYVDKPFVVSILERKVRSFLDAESRPRSESLPA